MVFPVTGAWVRLVGWSVCCFLKYDKFHSWADPNRSMLSSSSNQDLYLLLCLT